MGECGAVEDLPERRRRKLVPASTRFALFSAPGLRFYQWMMEKDRLKRLHNQDRLRQLRHAHAGEVEIFSGHDLKEFERLAGRPSTVPAQLAAAAAGFSSVSQRKSG